MSECDYGLWVLDGVGGSRFLFLFFILIIIIIYIQISLMGTCWSWSVATGNWVWFLGVCPNMIGLFGCFPTIIALGFHAPPTLTPPSSIIMLRCFTYFTPCPFSFSMEYPFGAFYLIHSLLSFPFPCASITICFFFIKEGTF